MLIITATFTRPNTSVAWFRQSDDFTNHFEINYRQTGKILEASSTISPDGLTLTRTATWASRADFMSLLEDGQYQILMASRDAHVTANGIVVNIERRLVPTAPTL
jgi:hypothetical protein